MAPIKAVDISYIITPFLIILFILESNVAVLEKIKEITVGYLLNTLGSSKKSIYG